MSYLEQSTDSWGAQKRKRKWKRRFVGQLRSDGWPLTHLKNVVHDSLLGLGKSPLGAGHRPVCASVPVTIKPAQKQHQCVWRNCCVYAKSTNDLGWLVTISYRPLILTRCVGKVMERIVNSRLKCSERMWSHHLGGAGDIYLLTYINIY